MKSICILSAYEANRALQTYRDVQGRSDDADEDEEDDDEEEEDDEEDDDDDEKDDIFQKIMFFHFLFFSIFLAKKLFFDWNSKNADVSSLTALELYGCRLKL